MKLTRKNLLISVAMVDVMTIGLVIGKATGYLDMPWIVIFTPFLMAVSAVCYAFYKNRNLFNRN